jgi:hypothetical protein
MSVEVVIKEPKVNIRTSRFSGAEWADQLETIALVGCGGIGSWTALNLSRIGHELLIYDGDLVDETNVNGGQMFRLDDKGLYKSTAILNICREFGCEAEMNTMDMFEKDDELFPITITGLDNMAARKLVYEQWKEQYGSDLDSLFIDGRLLVELAEVLTIQGGNSSQMAEYESSYIFPDSEVPEADCTNKQSTFAAMGIASMITATLCNFLTNRKLGKNIREVPFYQRMIYPIFDYSVKSI